MTFGERGSSDGMGTTSHLICFSHTLAVDNDSGRASDFVSASRSSDSDSESEDLERSDASEAVAKKRKRKRMKKTKRGREDVKRMRKTSVETNTMMRTQAGENNKQKAVPENFGLVM